MKRKQSPSAHLASEFSVISLTVSISISFLGDRKGVKNCVRGSAVVADSHNSELAEVVEPATTNDTDNN